jgi:hypothetical protein
MQQLRPVRIFDLSSTGDTTPVPEVFHEGRELFPPTYASFHDRLRRVKEDLNQVKSEIDREIERVRKIYKLDGARLFSHASRAYDPFSKLEEALFKKFKISHATNAWTKLWSILYSQIRKVLPPVGSSFSSLNIGGYPGSWDYCLDRFLAQMRPDLHANWDWLMTSYRPENSPTDRYLRDTYGVTAKNASQVIFGAEDHPEHNGDVTKEEIIIALVERTRARFPDGVNLAIGDIGKPEEDFNKQETEILYEDIGQLLVALGSLARGGSTVLKVFTQFEPTNVTLNYIASTLFEKFYFVKPPTSRDANSERYIVGLNFRGMPSDLWPKLLQSFTDLKRFCLEPGRVSAAQRAEFSLMGTGVPPVHYLDGVLDMEMKLAETQKNAIHGQLRILGDLTVGRNADTRQHVTMANMWIAANEIRKFQYVSKIENMH